MHTVQYTEIEAGSHPYGSYAKNMAPYPIASVYGIFTYVYHKTNQPNVGKYTIHGWYGYVKKLVLVSSEFIGS